MIGPGRGPQPARRGGALLQVWEGGSKGGQQTGRRMRLEPRQRQPQVPTMHRPPPMTTDVRLYTARTPTTSQMSKQLQPSHRF
eukprot:1449675-Lingulodinium_polyedra.AAC.1